MLGQINKLINIYKVTTYRVKRNKIRKIKQKLNQHKKSKRNHQ